MTLLLGDLYSTWQLGTGPSSQVVFKFGGEPCHYVALSHVLAGMMG